MHKGNKKTKVLVEAWPIDDDEGLAAVLAGHTSKDPVAFFATCLEREECALMTPTPGRRGSGGGGGIQTLLAAVEIERGSAAWEKTLILEVHLGIVAGTHGHEEATPTQIALRASAYGNYFEPDVNVRVINEDPHPHTTHASKASKSPKAKGKGRLCYGHVRIKF